MENKSCKDDLRLTDIPQTPPSEMIEVEIPLHEYTTMCGNKTYININPNQPALQDYIKIQMNLIIDKTSRQETWPGEVDNFIDALRKNILKENK